MTVHLLIHGKVQGVYYRASAKEAARQWQLTGWVRNTAAGKVEAMVTGTETNIQSFIRWCHQGPRHAHVTKVDVTNMPDTIFNSFEITK